jgi:EpsI family protein
MGWTQYIPAGLLLAGAVTTISLGTPRPMPLERPLSETMNVPFLGLAGKDVPIDSVEQVNSGVTTYFNRAYEVGSAIGPMLLYIGYHATQQGAHGIHLPTVCLPGSGWTPISASEAPVTVGTETFKVNRYILEKSGHLILVYYWFQGRGKVTSGETDLKMHSYRDALLHQRDEEALARIVVPVTDAKIDMLVGTTGLHPDTLATRFAAEVIPTLQKALPTPP